MQGRGRNIELIKEGPFAGYPRHYYGVIMIDPPWRFVTYSDAGLGRAPQAHYDCMTLDDIKALPVWELAAPNCLFGLWAIDPLLPYAFDVLRAYRAIYKTVLFYWVKTRRKADAELLQQRDFFIGLGYWTRGNPEQCLLGTIGHPKRLSRSVRKLIVSRIREHSRKPDTAYNRVMELVDGPYLELFARERRPGWDAWGNEVDKFSLTTSSIYLPDHNIITPKNEGILTRTPSKSFVDDWQ